MINRLEAKCSGYIFCKSDFYTVLDIIDERQKFEFSSGINEIRGEIDSGIFAISFLLSMHEKVDSRLLAIPPTIVVDEKEMLISDFQSYSCYMDSSYKLFSSSKSVEELVSKGLKTSKLAYSSNDICDMFNMENFRFKQPIKAVGNERFRAMAAIGFSYGKSVFCFPWMSRRRFDSFSGHLTDTLQTLRSLNKISIVPIGY